LPICEFYT